MPRTKIAAERSDHQYFTIIPHLVLALCRDPYEYTLWSVVKLLAGDGECVCSTRDLARLCGCGLGKIGLARTYLIEAGLLTGEVAHDPELNQPVWHLAVPDLWRDNAAWRTAIGPGRKTLIAAIEATRQAQGCSPGEQGCSPGEHPRAPGEHLTKDASLELRGKEVKSINDIPITELWERAKNQLRLQMTKSTYETWIRDTVCLDAEGGGFVIGVANAYALDWLSLRLRPLIKRTLAAIVGGAVDLTFVIAKPEAYHGAETDL